MMLRRGSPAKRLSHYAMQGLKGLLWALFILACIYGINRFKLSHYFPIKTVRVFGVNRADHGEVQNIVKPLVHGGFFTVNVEDIHDRLLQMPWVADSFVRREWPDRIEITVIEKNAIARWNNLSLLSTGGELFSPKLDTYPQNLPHFVGPEGKQIVMLQYYTIMNQLFLPIHARINYLELSPFFTWKLTLDNGITLQMGHKDILTRLAHFVKVYPKIVGNHAADVDYIDLRYANGVAVRWKETIKT